MFCLTSVIILGLVSGMDNHLSTAGADEKKESAPASKETGLVKCDIIANKNEKKIKIDGDLSEWPKKNPVTLDKGTQIMPDVKLWSGENDLSATGYLMYDKDYLYFGCDVKDDVHLNSEPPETLWKQDSIQIGGGNLKSGAKFEIGFSLTSEGIKIFQWFGTAKLEGINIAIKPKKDKKGVIYEAAIPLKIFEPVKFEPGNLVLLTFIVNDDDGKGRKWIGVGNSGALGATKDLSFYPLLYLKP